MGVPFFALTVVMATSVGLMVVGRRYFRGYFSRRGTHPPATWMFARADDPDLERLRRVALVLLPIDVIAALIYLARPGP
jgi:hypothetical protein